MVLFVHFITSFTPTTFFERSLLTLSGYGTLAIDMFFMLSGLLITGILIDTKSDPNFFRSFIVRRVLRVFPLYYLVLAVIYLGLALLPLDMQTQFTKVAEAQPWAWSYLFNFFIAREGAWTVPYIGHFWSLAVEEQFYLLWPFAVFYLSGKHLSWLSAGLVIFSTGCQLVLELLDFSSVTIHVLTPCRLSALCLGALMAQYLRQKPVYQDGPKPIIKRAWQIFFASVMTKLFIVAVVKLMPETHRALEAFRTLTWLGLFAALHLGAIAADKSSLIHRSLNFRILLFLGKYSYGIYIFHHFFSWPSEQYHWIDWLSQRLPNQTLAIFANAAFGMSISILLGWLSYHAFEKHFLQLKDRFAPRRDR
jgi:peptidoglycan/LPS O-acetylase OafA/YrhL